MSKEVYIIAGGGTGGHIYPGLAVAKAITNIKPSADVVFVGTAVGLESKIVPKEGFTLELIKIGKLNRAGGILTQIKTLVQIPFAFWQSYLLLKKYQPCSVLGVGGYASGPIVLIASLLGFPTAIWEANAHPGLTNRLLTKFVSKVFLVFAEAGTYFAPKKIEVVGLPVRAEIEQALPFVESNKFRILIFGGSQGARAINNAVSDLILHEDFSDIQFVHQTGRLDYQAIKEKYKGKEQVVQCYEFLYDMNVQYANCDLVICRGGASTVAELSACGKAAIIIPLPTAADNHQQKNAEALLSNSAGVMLLQKDLTVERLKHEILNLKNDPELRKKIESNIKKLFIPRAAHKMSEELIRGLK